MVQKTGVKLSIVSQLLGTQVRTMAQKTGVKLSIVAQLWKIQGGFKVLVVCEG